MDPRRHQGTLARGLAALATLATIGCGSADENDPTDGEPATCAEEPCVDEATGLPACADTAGDERCVDDFGAELCPVETGYPGDEMALCLPDPQEGMQLRYGPSDYDDTDEVALFLLPGGGDDENCTIVETPNDADVLVKEYRGRLRPGSHHLIITLLADDATVTNAPASCDLGDVVTSRWLVGSQDPQIDISVAGAVPGQAAADPGDPDFGLAQTVAARQKLRLDMHYVNASTETVMREAWVNFVYADPAEVENLVDMITFYQTVIDVPPQSTFTTARVGCEATTDRYVGLVTGHAHKTMTRFSVWHEAAGGAENLIYETYDWAEPGNLFYSDGIENPTPDAAANAFGGASGYVFVKAGERLTFECAYDNPGDTAVHFGGTGADEMCNIFGMYYPTDGAQWNCVCVGERCDALPTGLGLP